MPTLITPKDPVPAKAFHISEETPADIWDCRRQCTKMGLTFNIKWYEDSSPSAPDGPLGVFTIRPTEGTATAANTLTGNEGDWVTWDGINLVVKTDTEVKAAYALS